VSGQVHSHLLAGTVYTAAEDGHTTNVTTSNPADLPFLPYLTFENAFRWTGAQARDSWSWSKANSILIGLDYEHVASESRSYARTGARQAPFSADNEKTTAGVYVENTFMARQGRTVLSLGGRLDRISVETVDTPFKTNFAPSTTTFTVFNPSVGAKQELMSGLRLHMTAGRAFVPADAGALTGYTTTVVGGRTQINQGNPDLKPEHSVSIDGGIEWLAGDTHLDATYFHTRVKDRVVSSVLVSNPPPPDPIVLTAVNTLASRINGLDLEATHRLNPTVTLFSNVTHYFSRREQLPTTGERDILNVPTNTIRAGVDLDWRRLSARVSGRYVQGRQDQDFNVAGSPVVAYPDFTVVDGTASYRVRPGQAIVLTLNNVFDAFYYEKKGYPLAGLAWSLKYRLGR
jgi:outer membrane receptor protein involved in Fe transport